jgi:hypothetical protein
MARFQWYFREKRIPLLGAGHHEMDVEDKM